MAENKRNLSWKTVVLMIAAVLAALAGASYLVYGSLHSGRINPLALLVLAAAVSIAIPMIRANLMPSARDCETEYAFHEQRLEKDIMRRVGDAFGPEALNRMFVGTSQDRSAAARELENLLAHEQVRRSPDLRFALLLTLARWHEKGGDPQAAIPLLAAALDIKPRDFIARMHLAANCEWIGAVADARWHYRTLLEHPRDLSVAMKKLVADKIEQGL